MDLSYGRAALPVIPTRPLRVRDAQGRHLSVLKGTVWITQDGDLRDIVLEAGADFVFDRPGLAVVQALGAGAVVAAEEGIELERPASPLPGPVARLWHRIERARKSMQARVALRSLSDRELRDIGICRAQIELVTC